jgi:ectoine hydroxylase-related dioxygenase (phytanoyl-CoA dioxygenase family)
MKDDWTFPEKADVTFYEEHGWWVSPQCLSDSLIDELIYGAERYYANERDTPLAIDLPTDWTEEKGNILRQNDYVSLQMNEFRNILIESQLAATAGILAGTSSIRLFHDQLLYKPPGVEGPQASVGWHTDRAYWQTCTSTSMISAWIPLQDSTAEMGSLAVFDGSHLWEEDTSFRNFHSGDMTNLRQRLEDRGLPVQEKILELRKGQVSFHHCKTMHGSYPNRSPRPRLAFAVHFQDATNAYVAAQTVDGKQVIHFNDLLCRRDANNQPDYADPEICPLLWEQT